MAGRKLTVSFSPVVKQIDKAAKTLKSMRPRVSALDQKKIDLELKDLKNCRKVLSRRCPGKTMSHSFHPR
jgi:hypothetical protein